MDTNLLLNEKDIIDSETFFPTVSIILPFDPKMLKAKAEYILNKSVDIVKTALMRNYPREKATSLINKLQLLVRSVNYNTHTKSIALFISPLVEKIAYLNIPVEEKIVIDDSFEIRDLVYNKKQLMQYLVVLISGNHTKMYLGDGRKFIKLILDQPDNIHAYVNDAPERVGKFSDPVKHKEIITNKYLHHIDNSLSIILQSYPFPVFMLGAEKLLGHFKQTTKNTKNIVQYIHGNYEESSETEIRKTLDPHITNWKNIRQQHLLSQIEEGIGTKKTACGISEVWRSSVNKNSQLLIVEKDFVYSPKVDPEPGSKEKKDNRFYIKDMVDDIMERVLNNGGDVEFVDNELLKDYGHIALLKYY
ncbi:MAG: hypothetical protein WDM71_09425 [Ferruginibacter sp.]